MVLARSFSLIQLQRYARQRQVASTTAIRSGRLFATTASEISSDISGVTRDLLSDRVRAALIQAFGDDGKDADAMLVPAKPEFGDFQCNAALPLAKKLKAKPKDLAEKLMATLAVQDLVVSMDISGPGFINMHLSEEYVKGKLTSMLRDPERLAIKPVAKRQRVIVDFSSPNIAKEMHVGHLRSTIIGDSLSRVLEFLGHDVLRLNHVGDWGTQFGMLIRFMQDKYPNISSADGQSLSSTDLGLGDLVEFYKAAKKRFDEDKPFEEAARAEVVRLQGGDEGSLRAWRAICDMSRVEFQKIYDMLNVQVQERGESFYNPMLPSLVQDLEAKGAAVQSEGATCVFVPGYTNPDGSPQPLIVKKSDGGFLYATTDLAAIRQRSLDEKADRVLYVTDVGQSQHFEMVFKAATLTGLVDTAKTELKHVPFGLVQGEDGKKFKTRSGDTVKLKDLLDEAVRIAEEDLAARVQRSASDLTPEEKDVARIVGISAVKYADLSMNRESNYRFSYQKMLSLTGNTAPYMLYAFARIQGIKRKAVEAIGEGDGGAAALGALDAQTFTMTTSEEKALAKQLMRLDEVLGDVSRELYPSKVCCEVLSLLWCSLAVRVRSCDALKPRRLLLVRLPPRHTYFLLNFFPVTLLTLPFSHLSSTFCVHPSPSLAFPLPHHPHSPPPFPPSSLPLPSQLCEYLFELSQKFNQFYEKCPVLKAESRELRQSRTALCALTAGTPTPPRSLLLRIAVIDSLTPSLPLSLLLLLSPLFHSPSSLPYIDTLKLSLGLLGIDTVEKL